MNEEFHINEEGIQKGDEAELMFKAGLEKHNFMIPNFGFIFVDVKNRHRKYKTYPLDTYETKRYSSLQRRFNMQIYAISNSDYNYKTWLWIPVSKVMETEVPKYSSSKSHQEFYALPPEEFIQIADDDSLDRLFSKSFMA